MKPFLLLLSLLISVPVFSQHYRTVLVDKEVYFDFKDSDLDVSRLVHTDSFQSSGNDTIIFHKMNQEFEVFMPPYDPNTSIAYCYFPIDTGFLGMKTLLKADGTDVFFNRFQDSIFIETEANLNDTWTFHTDTSGSYFEATVNAINYESFLGISDSVKIITLQAKDSLGNEISSPYDTLQIKISQNYGLIEGFNLFRFPYGVTTGFYIEKNYNPIKLVGLSHLNIGTGNLTAAEVYGFDIGDEFHWVTHSPVTSQIVWCEDNYYDIMKITNKYFSNNGDSVYYQVDLQSYFLNCDVDFPPISSTTVFDTLFIGDTLIGYDISPNNPINTKTLHRTDSTVWLQSENGDFKVISNTIEPSWNASGCYPASVSPFTIRTKYYHKGIGQSFNYYDLWGSENKYIAYYNKNGNIYGTPLNIDSLSTVSTDEIVKNDLNINLKVFPNPTKNLLNFQFTEPIQNAEIRIYSSIGQLMLNQNVNDTNVQFDVSDWPRNLGGIYFYGIYVEGKVVKQGQVLVQD